eukprot:CAMPEP_0184709466 /NCGR_PEP_ID=MMETSP0314-20130426/606_1 /TAXON_ID=38298 /ORGANISM="Rhodella maculata, Strain CCMP 736" /LENGTH=87 /DNA_ID=CAMNT_0027171175 /DNA_START=53 /DNA_END=312 /DNA_ORIENTATION=+
MLPRAHSIAATLGPEIFTIADVLMPYLTPARHRHRLKIYSGSVSSPDILTALLASGTTGSKKHALMLAEMLVEGGILEHVSEGYGGG